MLFILAFAAGLQAQAQQGTQDEETRRYAEIDGLLADGLNERAMSRISDFLRDFPGSQSADVLRFKLAELQFAADAYGDAVQTLERFVAEHQASPRIDEARFLLASAYRLVDRYADARRVLGVMLDNRRLEEGLRIAALERRADIALQLGEPEEALKDLEEVVRRAATPQRQLRLANVYYDVGRFRQAEREYDRLKDEASFSPEERRTVVLRLSLVLYQRQRYREIVNLLQPRIDEYRDDEAVLMSLAWALYKLDRNEEAFKLVSGRPRSAQTKLASDIREGRSLLMLQEYGAAIQFFERLLKDTEPNAALAPAFRALSDAYFALGDVAGGIGTLERMAPSLDDDELRFALWVEIGDLYRERGGDDAGAISAYLKALAIIPRGAESEEVSIKLLRAQLAIGNVGGGTDSVTRFFEEFPESRFIEEVLYISGQLLERMGEDERALEQYRKIAQHRGKSPFRSKAYEAGIELTRRLRRWEEVISIGREFLQEFPEAGKRAGIHLALARAYYQMEQYREGVAHYEQALTAEDGEVDVADVNLQIGWGLYKQGNLARAAEHYALIVESYPDSAKTEEALYWLGWIAQVGGNLELANQHFNRLLQRFPASRYAEISLWQVANNSIRRDDGASALAALNAIVDNHPDGQYAELARDRLVETYVGLGNYRAALDRIEEFVENDPGQQTSPNAMLSKADSLAEAGNRRAALELLRRLLERFPSSEVADEATLDIGILLYQMGNFNEAVTQLRRVAEFFPQSDKVAAAAYYLGQSLMRLRRYEDAIEQFNTTLERGGEGRGSEIIHYLIGVCCEQLGDGPGAVAAYRKYMAALQNPREELGRRLGIAQLFARNGALDEAAAQLESILQVAEAPDMIVEAQFALGAVYEQKNELARAAVEYLKVTYVHSSSALAALSARFRAGQLFEQLGQWQDAINVYEKIAENHKGSRFGQVAAMRIEALRKRMESEGERTSEEPKP